LHKVNTKNISLEVMKRKIIAFTVFSLCFGFYASSQGTPGPGLMVPIDGGVLFGLVLGLFYGVRKLLKQK